MSVESLPPLRDVIARYDLMARKSLGQHFLCDLNLTRRIAEHAGDLSGCTVYEVGPGPGGLTRALLGTSATKIIAIEKDQRCLGALKDIFAVSDHRLQVIEGDAMKTDYLALAPEPRAIVANLPYNIGTELLINWLHQMDAYRSLTLMFQLEVAERLIATPGTKAYGRLSILTQFCSDVQMVMTLPARAFTPPPKVDSAVVHLTPRKNRPKDIDIKLIEVLTGHAFGQRRKMLRSSLKQLGGEALLLKANIAPTLRAENLSLDDFENLARLLSSVSGPVLAHEQTRRGLSDDDV